MNKIDIDKALAEVDSRYQDLLERDAAGCFKRGVPCPQCGGRDRFNARECEDGVTRAFCRKCNDAGMDAFDYVLWRGMAQPFTGKDGKSHPLIGAMKFWDVAGEALQGGEVKAERPKPCDMPSGDAWQRMAGAFVDECVVALWSDEGIEAREYLHGRGLSDETIMRFRLGFNVRRREWPADEWDGSKPAVAHAGITIPRYVGGVLWCVNVRRPAGSDPKYLTLTGSKLGLFNADAIHGAKMVIAFGGEFDAMLAAQYAPADVACVTFGGEGRRIVSPWLDALMLMSDVAVCMDTDEAGDKGAMHWLEVPKARRVRVPGAKDFTDFVKAGGDGAAWLRQVAEGPRRRQRREPIVCEFGPVNTCRTAWDEACITVVKTLRKHGPLSTKEVLLAVQNRVGPRSSEGHMALLNALEKTGWIERHEQRLKLGPRAFA